MSRPKKEEFLVRHGVPYSKIVSKFMGETYRDDVTIIAKWPDDTVTIHPEVDNHTYGIDGLWYELDQVGDPMGVVSLEVHTPIRKADEGYIEIDLNKYPNQKHCMSGTVFSWDDLPLSLFPDQAETPAQ